MSKVGQRILTNLREVVTMAELQAELTRLRADLAAVTAERDRMREALRPFAKLKPVSWSLEHDIYHISTDDITAALAALEGVTEPPR